MSTKYTAKELEGLINTILLPAYNAMYYPKNHWTLEMLISIHKHNNSAALLKKPRKNNEQNFKGCTLTS